MTLGERVAKAGLVLPPAFAPVASYVGSLRAGAQLHVSGMGPTQGKAIVETGQIATATDLDKAKRASHLTALNLLAQIDAGLRVMPVKIFALINVCPDFTALDDAIEPARKVFAGLFGHPGAWTIVGAPTLPFAITTEMEAIFAVEE